MKLYINLSFQVVNKSSRYKTLNLFKEGSGSNSERNIQIPDLSRTNILDISYLMELHSGMLNIS